MWKCAYVGVYQLLTRIFIPNFHTTRYWRLISAVAAYIRHYASFNRRTLYTWYWRPFRQKHWSLRGWIWSLRLEDNVTTGIVLIGIKKTWRFEEAQTMTAFPAMRMSSSLHCSSPRQSGFCSRQFDNKDSYSL